MLHTKFLEIFCSIILFLPVQVSDLSIVDTSGKSIHEEALESKTEDGHDRSDDKAIVDLKTKERIKQKPTEPYEVFSIKQHGTTPLSDELLLRQKRISTCLQQYYSKPVNADRLRPWSIMHGVLAYGRDSLVTSRGNPINAVDYLCANGIGHDRRLLMLDSRGLSVSVGTGFQGHEGQLLAILGQVKTPIDHKIQIQDQSFTLKDLIEFEKLSCRPNTELTFKLIGLLNYLDSDEEWTDSVGSKWNLSRLIFEELKQPINGAACGGTHRLMGLSYAVETRKSRKEPIDGQWKRAESFVQSYIDKAFRLQNSDGGFSTEFFEGKSNTPDRIRQIYATGHALEWLSIALSDEELEKPEMGKMVDFLLDLMEKDYRPQAELHGNDVGPKGHALRALRLYELRAFGEPTDFNQLKKLDFNNLADAYDYVKSQHRISTINAPTPSDRGNVVSPASTNSPPRNNTRFMRRR